MEKQCACRRILGNPRNLIIWLAYVAIVGVNLSLTVGSFMEYEPKAGRMFGIIAAASIVLGGLLAWRLTRGVKK